MQRKSLYIFLLLVLAGNYTEAQRTTPIVKAYGQNRFINKNSFEIKDSVVCFFLRGNLTAKRVVLSGNFINWSQSGVPMTKTDNGWITYVNLSPGKFWYKFIIDGSWQTDADNALSETDENGNVNSIFYRPNIAFTLPGFSRVKKVFLSVSLNNGKSDELPMFKTQNGWELPLYLTKGIYTYRFIADGKIFVDPKNIEQLPDEKDNLSSVKYIGVPDDLIQIFRSYQKALSSHNKNEIAVNLTQIGTIYLSQSDYSNALKEFEKAAGIYQQLKKYDSAGSVYLKMEEAYRYSADFSKQLFSIQHAIKSFEQARNEIGLAEATKRIGYYYTNMSEWSKAAEYYEKALVLFQRLGNQVQVANMLSQVAHASSFFDKAKSIEYRKKALTLNEKIGNQLGIAGNLSSLGADDGNNNRDFQTTVKNFTKALEIYEKEDSKGGIAEMLLAFARLYLQESDSNLRKLNIIPSEKYSKAIANEKRSLQLYTELKNKGRQQFGINFLRETYERMGMYDSALYYYRRWVDGQDNYYNTAKQKEITRMETQFLYEKIEDSLNNEKKLTDEKLQKQLILVKQQQQQLELNQAELSLANTEKDLQNLAFLKTKTDLQNEQLIKKQNEKENQLQSAQLKSLTQDKAITKLNQQRQWIYIIGVFFLLGLGSIYFLYRSRLQSVRLENQLVKEKAAQEKKEAEFQQKLADISMSALRSQMNPHFIFNCLNSIKLYTTQNDTVAASEYLSKFSKLIRLVLDNSRNERITLSSELAALELYIEMEAMRFKEKLSYSLVVEKEVETDYIEIPPLLLQPYVENAIWHGLMPKEDGGRIDIRVAINQEESLLEISITDNGIGRAAASALNNKIASKHRSYGMKATTERIVLINQLYKTGASVVVHDLVDEDGQAVGTEVILQIPV